LGLVKNSYSLCEAILYTLRTMEMDTNQDSTVQVDFTLKVGEGRLDASLQVPAGDVTLTQLLPVLQTLTSSVVDSAVRIANSEGYKVSCKAGCGACCRQLVPLSIFEAEYLSEWIQTLPEVERAAIEARFDAALSKLRDSGMLARLTQTMVWEETNEEARMLTEEYLHQRVPCPFLVEESCSIHPIRPLICREYLVTSPPEFCANPTRETVKGIPMPIKLSTVLFRLGGHVEHRSNGWIPLVFLFAWMKGNSHPGAVISGPGPELLHGVIKRIGK
jgi:Fe-S-cluster containining protein